MWFIFPQLDGLAFSSTSKHYAIKSLEEARAYLAHPVLGPRLRQCAEAALGIEGRSATQIFGTPDDMKLRSCPRPCSPAYQARTLCSTVCSPSFMEASVTSGRFGCWESPEPDLAPTTIYYLITP